MDATEVRLSRLEKAYDRLSDRVAANERAIAAIPYLQEDIKEIRENSNAIRVWVEEREAEKERVSGMQIAAIIGASAVVIASILSAVATLIA